MFDEIFQLLGWNWLARPPRSDSLYNDKQVWCPVAWEIFGILLQGKVGSHTGGPTLGMFAPQGVGKERVNKKPIENMETFGKGYNNGITLRSEQKDIENNTFIGS